MIKLKSEHVKNFDNRLNGKHMNNSLTELSYDCAW